MITTAIDSPKPIAWYRQFWPWFLIALPASSVVAGITTLLIASADPDSLVVDNYYREGLAINEDLARRRAAVQRGLSGRLALDTSSGTLRLTLVNVESSRLALRLIHPTRADGDLSAVLYRDTYGTLSGQLRLPVRGRWRVLVEPDDASWRLSGRLTLPATSLELTPG